MSTLPRSPDQTHSAASWLPHTQPATAATPGPSERAPPSLNRGSLALLVIGGLWLVAGCLIWMSL
ncbi:MAG: hypothetical protein IAE82_15670 [Opitutaceae bacterium]|nr:hypothetical protein [Opitutaceae bacterium]